MPSSAPMPNEGVKPYHYFCVYRDMGEKRTTEAVAKKCGLSVSFIAKCATKFKWVQRVKSWQAEQNELRTQAELEVMKEEQRELAARRKQVRENAWKTHEALIQSCNKCVRTDSGEAKAGKVSDAARLAVAADLMGRIGADMPIVTRSEITGAGGKLLNPTVAPIITIRVMSDSESKNLLREARVNLPKE